MSKAHHADHNALLVMQAHNKRIKAEMEEATAGDEPPEFTHARRQALCDFFCFVRHKIEPLDKTCKVNGWLLRVLNEMEENWEDRISARSIVKPEPDDF